VKNLKTKNAACLKIPVDVTYKQLMQQNCGIFIIIIIIIIIINDNIRRL